MVGWETYLPSNHTESTHKLTPSIRAFPFTQTQVNGQISVKSLCDLLTREFGHRIPSLHVISAVTGDLRSEQQAEKQDLFGKDAFTSVTLSEFAPLCNYSVMYGDIFYLMVPAGV